MRTKDYSSTAVCTTFTFKKRYEVPDSTSTAALFLQVELSVLPIKFEIEQRQMFF